MTKDTDYSVETEEEFYEDFSSVNLSDKKLNQILIEARKNSDAELRIIIKELQYTRLLLKNIVENVVDHHEDNEFLTIQKLVKNYINAVLIANSKNL